MLTVMYPRGTAAADVTLRGWLRRNTWPLAGLAAWAAVMIVATASIEPALRLPPDLSCTVLY